METVTVTLKLHTDTDENGKRYMYSEIDDTQIENLAYCLLSCPELQKLTLMTASNIIATDPHPIELWNKMEELIQEIREERKSKNTLHKKDEIIS